MTTKDEPGRAALVADIVLAKRAEQLGDRRPVAVAGLLQRLCPDPARRMEAIALLLGIEADRFRTAGERTVRAGKPAP